MQKLAKRAAQAQRQAVRRAARIADENRRTEQNRARRYLKEANAEIRTNIHDARRARKEDWELGPLAPKRDLGFNGYGEVSTSRRDWSQNGQYKINPELAVKRCAWAGGVKQFCLAPGDRVVIVDGQEKGKIDRVKSVHPEDGFVLLEKLNRVCTDVPSFTNTSANIGRPLKPLLFPTCLSCPTLTLSPQMPSASSTLSSTPRLASSAMSSSTN